MEVKASLTALDPGGRAGGEEPKMIDEEWQRIFDEGRKQGRKESMGEWVMTGFFIGLVFVSLVSLSINGCHMF